MKSSSEKILSLFLGSFIHILLILLFEGIFIFVILFPILKNVANNISTDVNNSVFAYLLQNGYSANIVNNNPQNIQWWQPQPKQSYSFKPPITTFLQACAIDEEKYLKMQTQMPYIIYAILLFVLCVSIIIIIVITKKFNIKIDYVHIGITSFISFILICSYAFIVLFFTLTQPYSLNLEADAYQTFLDLFKNA